MGQRVPCTHEALTIALPYLKVILMGGDLIRFFTSMKLYLSRFIAYFCDHRTDCSNGQRPSGAVEYYPPEVKHLHMAYILNGDVREEDIATLIVS